MSTLFATETFKNGANHIQSRCQMRFQDDIQELFHVYLNKIEIAVSHLFLLIFSNNKFKFVNLISRNA